MDSMKQYSYILHLAGWSFIPSLLTSCSALVVIFFRSSFWAQKASLRTTAARSESDTDQLNETNQASSTETGSRTIFSNPDAYIEEIDPSKFRCDVESQRSSFISEVYKQLYDEEFKSTAAFNQEPFEYETNRNYSKDIDETLNCLTDEEVNELKDKSLEVKINCFGNNFKSDLSTGRIEIEYKIQPSHNVSSDTLSSNNNGVRVSISDEINILEFSSYIEDEVPKIMEEPIQEPVPSNVFAFFNSDEHLSNLSVMHKEPAEMSVFDEILGAVLFEQISDIITPLVIESDYSILTGEHNVEIGTELQDLPLACEYKVTDASLTQIIPQDNGDEEKVEENPIEFQNKVFEIKYQMLPKPIMIAEESKNKESHDAKTTPLPMIASAGMLCSFKLISSSAYKEPLHCRERQKILDIIEIKAQCVQKHLVSEINDPQRNMAKTLTEVVENLHVTEEKYPKDDNEVIEYTEKGFKVKGENVALKFTKAKEEIMSVGFLIKQFERKNFLQNAKLGNTDMRNHKSNIEITNSIRKLIILEDDRFVKNNMKNHLTKTVKNNDFKEICTNILRVNAKVIPKSIKDTHLENIKEIIHQLIKHGADFAFTSNSYLKYNSSILQKLDFSKNNDENRVMKNDFTCGRNVHFKSTIACTEEFPISRKNLIKIKKSKFTSQVSKSFDIFNPLNNAQYTIATFWKNDEMKSLVGKKFDVETPWNNIRLHVDNQATEIVLEVKYENVAMTILETDVNCKKTELKNVNQIENTSELINNKCLRNRNPVIEHGTINVNFLTVHNANGYTHNSSSTLGNERSIPNVSCDLNEIETILRRETSDLFSAQSSNQSIAECLLKSKGLSLQLVLHKDNIVIGSSNSSLSILKSRKNSSEIDLKLYISKPKLSTLDHASSSENELEPSPIDYKIEPYQHSISKLNICLSHNICFSQNNIQVNFSHEICVIPKVLINKSVQHPSDNMGELININIMSVKLGLTDLDCGYVTTTTTYTQTFRQCTLGVENVNPQDTHFKDYSKDTISSNIDQDVPLCIGQLKSDEPPKTDESPHFDNGLQCFFNMSNHDIKGFSPHEIIEKADTFVQKTSDVLVANKVKSNGFIYSSKDKMLESQFSINIPVEYLDFNNKPIAEWPNLSTNEVFPKNIADMSQPSELFDESNDLSKVSFHSSIHILGEERIKIDNMNVISNSLKTRIFLTAEDSIGEMLTPMIRADLKESSIMLGKVMNKHSKCIFNEKNYVNVANPSTMDTTEEAQRSIAETDGNTVYKHLDNIMDADITFVVPQKTVTKKISELIICGNDVSVRDDNNLESVISGCNIITPHNINLKESQIDDRRSIIKRERPKKFSESKTTLNVSITHNLSEYSPDKTCNLKIKLETNVGPVFINMLAEQSKLLSHTTEYFEFMTTDELGNVEISDEDNINRCSEKGQTPNKNHSTQIINEKKSKPGKVKRSLTVAYLLDQSERKKSLNNISNLSKEPSLESIHSTDRIINKLNITKSMDETKKSGDGLSQEFAKTPELNESETFQNEMTYTSVHNMDISVAKKNNDDFEIPSEIINNSTKVIPEGIQNIRAHNIKRLMHDLIKPCVDVPWDTTESQNELKCKLTESKCTTNYIESKNSWQNVSNVHFKPPTSSIPKSERSQPPNILDPSKGFDLQNPLNNVNFSFETMQDQNERHLNRVFDIVNPLNNVCLNVNKFMPKINISKQSQANTFGPSFVESGEDSSREEQKSSSFIRRKKNIKNDGVENYVIATDTKDNILSTVSHKPGAISVNSKVSKKKKTVLVKEVATEIDTRFDANSELDLDDTLLPSVNTKRHTIKKTIRIKDNSTEPFNPNNNDPKPVEDVSVKKKTERAKSATTEPMVNNYYLDRDTVAALSAKKKKTKKVKNQGTAPINIEPSSKGVSKPSNDAAKTGESLENRKFNVLYMFGQQQKKANDIIEKPETQSKKPSFKEVKHKLCNSNSNIKTNQRKCSNSIFHIDKKSIAEIKKIKPQEKNKQKNKYSEKTELLKNVWKVKRSCIFSPSQMPVSIKNPSADYIDIKIDSPVEPEKVTLGEKYDEIQPVLSFANVSLIKSDKPKEVKKASNNVLPEKAVITPKPTASDKKSYKTAIDEQKTSAIDLPINTKTRFERNLHRNPEHTEELTNPIILEINRYSFMGTWACRWERCTSEDWSFLLLHERVRLSVRLPNSERQCPHPDTPVLAIDIESVGTVDRAVAAHATTVCITCLRSLSRMQACTRAGDLPALLARCARAVRDAACWARAMQHASAHLGYRLDQGLLTLQVANVPLRSVWDVSLRVACEPRGPRATDVRVAAVCSDVEVSPARVAALLCDVRPGWANVTQTIWRLYRSLKYMTKDHPWST